MKIVQQTTTVALLFYHQCEIGQIYSRDKPRGTRIETSYYFRTHVGMANLDNGAFIPDKCFAGATGDCRDWEFKHCPDAQLTV